MGYLAGPIVFGDDAGFSDPAFIPNVGDLAQGAINRSAWDVGTPGSSSYKINEMFKAKYGRDLDDTSARWMQGFLVLADAINRAGSTEPGKIQEALGKTDLKPNELMIGYRGVKFDETGQNTLFGNLPDPAPGQRVQIGVAARSCDHQAHLADDRLEEIAASFV